MKHFFVQHTFSVRNINFNRSRRKLYAIVQQNSEALRCLIKLYTREHFTYLITTRSFQSEGGKKSSYQSILASDHTDTLLTSEH
jgi:hypothetical protein